MNATPDPRPHRVHDLLGGTPDDATLARWLHGLPRPLVLLGDFNLPGRIPARITSFVELVHEPTYPVMRPRVQLDHVLADGLTAHEQATAEAAVHLLPVSDHAAVSVDLDL